MFCKRQEGTDHGGRCPYHWGLLANGEMPVVTLRTAMIEDEDGCPLARLDRELGVDCEGCIECIDRDES